MDRLSKILMVAFLLHMTWMACAYDFYLTKKKLPDNLTDTVAFRDKMETMIPKGGPVRMQIGFAMSHSSNLLKNSDAMEISGDYSRHTDLESLLYSQSAGDKIRKDPFLFRMVFALELQRYKKDLKADRMRLLYEIENMYLKRGIDPFPKKRITALMENGKWLPERKRVIYNAYVVTPSGFDMVPVDISEWLADFDLPITVPLVPNGINSDENPFDPDPENVHKACTRITEGDFAGYYNNPGLYGPHLNGHVGALAVLPYQQSPGWDRVRALLKTVPRRVTIVIDSSILMKGADDPDSSGRCGRSNGIDSLLTNHDPAIFDISVFAATNGTLVDSTVSRTAICNTAGSFNVQSIINLVNARYSAYRPLDTVVFIVSQNAMVQIRKGISDFSTTAEAIGSNTYVPAYLDFLLHSR